MTAEAGYGYIDHGVDTPYVKIGKTPDLRQRLAGIQQGVPFPMQLLWAERVADIDHAEDILKQRYALYHIRGEWYALPPAMRSHWGITIPDTTAYEETYRVALAMILRLLVPEWTSLNSREMLHKIWAKKRSLSNKPLNGMRFDEKWLNGHWSWLRRQGFIQWDRSYYAWITEEGRAYLASLNTQEQDDQMFPPPVDFPSGRYRT